MTYLELINNFWQEFGNKGMQPNDVLLYFYLLDHCNRISWQNPFSLTNKNLMLMLEFSEKTLIGARSRLKERGLIDFEKGDRNCKSPVYLIIGVEVTNFNCKISSRKADERQKKGRRKAAIYIDYKTKDIDTDLQRAREEPVQTSQSAFDFLTEPPKKKSKAAKPEPVAPTLEQVMTYFLSKRADERLLNWEAEAEKFYSHYDALGWRNGAGTRIVRWDSMANKWILTQEQNDRKSQSGANQRRDVPTGLRAKLPPKPGCGLIDPDD